MIATTTCKCGRFDCGECGPAARRFAESIRTGEPPRVCAHFGESISGETRKQLQLRDMRDWHHCGHPKHPLGAVVCKCKGCGTACPGFTPKPAYTEAVPRHTTAIDSRGKKWSLSVVSYPKNHAVMSETIASVQASDWPVTPTIVMQPANWPVGWASTSRNYKRALQAAFDSNTDFALILEDDVFVNRDLFANLSQWWPAVSGQCHFASLFIPHLVRDPWLRECPELGYRIGHPGKIRGPKGTSWEKNRLWGSQAYLFSRQGLHQMLAKWDVTKGGQDARANTISAAAGWPIWYTMPCLVEHNQKVSAFGTPQARAPDFVSAGVVLTESTDSVYRHPEGVPGWLTYNEGKLLYQLSKGTDVLELGRHHGRSTCAIAQSARSIVSVDTISPIPAKKWLDVFAPNATVDLREARFSSLRGYGGKHGPFQLIFIDGMHDAKNIREDVSTALPLLDDNGLIAFHDFGEMSHPDVQPTVDAFAFQHQWERVRQIDRIAVFRIPKRNWFASLVTEKERAVLYELLKQTDAALTECGVRYTLCWGSLLGLVRFGKLMTWDDDIDLLAEGPLPIKELRVKLKQFTIDESGPYLKIHRKGHRFPFLEINPGIVNGDVIRTKSAFGLPDDEFPLALVFPTQRVLFGEIECSVPFDPVGLAQHKYGELCLTHARPPYWDHRNEKPTGFPQFRVPLSNIVE